MKSLKIKDLILSDFDLVISRSGKKGLICCDGKSIAWFNGKSSSLELEDIPPYIDRIINISPNGEEYKKLERVIIASVLNNLGDETKIIKDMHKSLVPILVNVVYSNRAQLDELLTEKNKLEERLTEINEQLLKYNDEVICSE